MSATSAGIHSSSHPISMQMRWPQCNRPSGSVRSGMGHGMGPPAARATGREGKRRSKRETSLKGRNDCDGPGTHASDAREHMYTVAQ